MLIEMRSPGSLTPYPSNPRVNDAGVDAVAASIRAFGFRQPVVVDEADVVVVGHTRLKAALKLGLPEIPVHVAVGLTPAQARAYRIADNQTATLSAWDDDKLPAELVALQGLGFDLGLTGFSADELDALLAPPPNAGQADPDDVPAVPEVAVTQPGDLWILGRHRLLCGDSTDPTSIAKVLDGNPADLLLTDPPYNVAYTGGTADRLTIANDDMDEAAYRQFLVASLGAAARHLRAGGAFYVWHADTHGRTVRDACTAVGLELRQCLVWVKPSLVLGRQDYHWRHEPCLYGWAAGAAHTWRGGRDQTTVLEFAKPAKSPDHPTTKPVDLFARLIENSCPPGGRVLDPFGGSGTTLLAAEATGRTACLVELDPRYCDVIARRFREVAGQTGQRVSPGA